MATALKEMMGKQISVITCDGRNIVGQLRGYDQVRETRRTARETPGATAASRRLRTSSSTSATSASSPSTPASSRWSSASTSSEARRAAPAYAAVGRARVARSRAGPRGRRAGDNIAVIGEVDIELDAQTDFSELRADALKPVTHT